MYVYLGLVKNEQNKCMEFVNIQYAVRSFFFFCVAHIFTLDEIQSKRHTIPTKVQTNIQIRTDRKIIEVQQRVEEIWEC